MNVMMGVFLSGVNLSQTTWVQSRTPPLSLSLCVCVCVFFLALYNKAQGISKYEFKLWTFLQGTESRVATFLAETYVMSHQSSFTFKNYIIILLSRILLTLCVCVCVCVCVFACVRVFKMMNFQGYI